MTCHAPDGCVAKVTLGGHRRVGDITCCSGAQTCHSGAQTCWRHPCGCFSKLCTSEMSRTLQTSTVYFSRVSYLSECNANDTYVLRMTHVGLSNHAFPGMARARHELPTRRVKTQGSRTQKALVTSAVLALLLLLLILLLLLPLPHVIHFQISLCFASPFRC